MNIICYSHKSIRTHFHTSKFPLSLVRDKLLFVHFRDLRQKYSESKYQTIHQRVVKAANTSKTNQDKSAFNTDFYNDVTEEIKILKQLMRNWKHSQDIKSIYFSLLYTIYDTGAPEVFKAMKEMYEILEHTLEKHTQSYENHLKLFAIYLLELTTKNYLIDDKTWISDFITQHEKQMPYLKIVNEEIQLSKIKYFTSNSNIINSKKAIELIKEVKKTSKNDKILDQLEDLFYQNIRIITPAYVEQLKNSDAYKSA